MGGSWTLLDVGLAAAALGPSGGALLAVVGVGLIVTGRRGFRFAAAAVAPLPVYFAARVLIDLGSVQLPVSKPMAAAGAAVLAAALGLLLPRLAVVVASAAAGLLGAVALHGALGIEEPLAIAIGATGLALVASVLSGKLPMIVPSAAGAAVAALGIWGAVGSTGVSPKLFRMPVVYLVLAGVLAAFGWVLEGVVSARRARRGRREQKEASDESARKKDEADRKRYAKYLE